MEIVSTNKQRALAALDLLKDEVEKWEEEIENRDIEDETLEEIIYWSELGRKNLESI